MQNLLFDFFNTQRHIQWENHHVCLLVVPAELMGANPSISRSQRNERKKINEKKLKKKKN